MFVLPTTKCEFSFSRRASEGLYVIVSLFDWSFLCPFAVPILLLHGSDPINNTTTQPPENHPLPLHLTNLPFETDYPPFEDHKAWNQSQPFIWMSLHITASSPYSTSLWSYSHFWIGCLCFMDFAQRVCLFEGRCILYMRLVSFYVDGV